MPDIYSGETTAPALPDIYSGAPAPTTTPAIPDIYSGATPTPEIPSIYSGDSAIPQLPDIYTTGAADAEAARLARSMTNTTDFELPDASGYKPEIPDIYSGETMAPKIPDIYARGGSTDPTLPDIYAKGATSSYADLIGERTGVDQPVAETSQAQSYADMIKSRLDATQGDAGQGYADQMQRRIDDTIATGPGEEYAAEQQRRFDTRQRADAGQNLANEAQQRLETTQVQRPQTDSIQEALNRQYMDRIGGGEDPILASQLADLRKRQQDEEAATIEQLSRYGVLRGGGDTASALMQMREGQSRNRLSLEASAAQRQQQDMRDALGFDQARSQQGLAGRGMTLQEQTGAESIANQQLNRQLQQAGVTGQYQGADTLQAQEQADRMRTTEAQRSAIGGGERRADVAQEAGLFGEVAGAGGAARSTMTGRQLEDQLVGSQQARELATAADRRAGVAQEAGLFGEVAGQGSDPTVRSTLAGEESDLRRQLALGAEGRADIAQQADLFGRVRPAGGAGPEVTTLGGRQASLQEELARSADERAGRAQESELFGKVTGPGAGGPDITTLGGMQALEGLRGSRMAREATEAGLTGQYEGGATVSEQNRLDALQTQDLQRRLATAGATGQIDLGGSQRPITTLAAQAQQDQLESSKQNRLIQEAGVTGQYQEEETAQERALRSQLDTSDQQRRLAESGVTGEYDFGDQRGRTDTLQADALAEEQKSQALQRALSRAGATGEFIEEGAEAGTEARETLESRLRTAQLTGRLGDEGGGKATIAGRQADMDVIGAILASQDDQLTSMTPDQKAKFGGALAASMDSMDPYQVSALRRSLGVQNIRSESDKEQFAAAQRAAQEPILASLNFTPEERAMFFDDKLDVSAIMRLRDQG